MPPKRAIEIRPGDQNNAAARKWHVSLTEDAFLSFLSHGGGGDAAAARAVFGEGSLFSPFLFGKFFDPADAFPLWDFDSDALLAGIRNAKNKTGADWNETDQEYILRAELPAAIGGKKYEVEINGDKTKVLEISGPWRAAPAPASSQDWRTGRWWEHGFVRRVELPDDANWRKAEAYVYDHESLLEIKIPKNNVNVPSAECSTNN